jgi:hypothetical protein
MPKEAWKDSQKAAIGKCCNMISADRQILFIGDILGLFVAVVFPALVPIMYPT